MKNAMGSNERFEVVVIGATPCGVAAAVRAAREGVSVLLTQHDNHVGGMCVNGLGQWDALSSHRRCAIFREILQKLEERYRDTEDAKRVTYSMDQYPVGSFAPGSMESIFNALVTGETNISLRLNRVPMSVATAGARIESVVLTDKQGLTRETVSASQFIDATYEGDLLPLFGADYHVGRESASDFDEPHAGKVFTGRLGEQPGQETRGGADVSSWGRPMSYVHPDSPRSGDNAVQAYNMRGCLTDDPKRRILIETAPDNYNRDEYLSYSRKDLTINCYCERKSSYNSPILPGENHGYPEGGWPERDAITKRHMDFGLGLIHFLQFDKSVPEERRAAARKWGLPVDEFVDNNHIPYEMYVRETRRLRGRHILTERDFTAQAGANRPPAFADSVAFMDWYMDSHSCIRDGTFGEPCRPDAPYDGKLILTDAFRPAMIPYRALLPWDIDNALVPLCCSATHVAWGAIRLEPCWIHLGEVAGFAAAIACRDKTGAARINVSDLQRKLLDSGASIAFFNQSESLLTCPDRADWELRACHGQWDSFAAPKK